MKKWAVFLYAKEKGDEMARTTSGADDWITEDGLLLIEGWARDGITDKDIAVNQLRISERTFTRWKRDYPSIVSALKKGRAPVIEKVEKSLYDLCQVQKYTETIEEIHETPDGKKKRHVRKITREMPPNPTAIIFTLKNLKPHKWRDKQEIKGDFGFEKEVPKLYEALEKGAVESVQSDTEDRSDDNKGDDEQ